MAPAPRFRARRSTPPKSSTGSIRSVVSNHEGLFRIPALNPGRYSLSVELSSFRTLTVADITAGEHGNPRSRQADPGGRRAHRDRHRHLRSHARADRGQLTPEHHHARRSGEHPDEGPRRDGAAVPLARRPGHQPQSRLRAVAIGDQPHHQRHAVAEQGRPRRRHQRRRRRRLRHGVRQPEHGRDRRSPGHRQRLHGRERAQQRRPHQHRHQVGHEPVESLRAGTTAGATSSTRTTTSANRRTRRSRCIASTSPATAWAGRW